MKIQSRKLLFENVFCLPWIEKTSIPYKENYKKEIKLHFQAKHNDYHSINESSKIPWWTFHNFPLLYFYLCKSLLRYCYDHGLRYEMNFYSAKMSKNIFIHTEMNECFFNWLSITICGIFIFQFHTSWLCNYHAKTVIFEQAVS